MFSSVFMVLTKIIRSQQLVTAKLRHRQILSWITNAFSVAAIISSVASAVFYTTVSRVDSETNSDEFFARDASMVYMYFDFHWYQLAGYAAPICMILSGVGYFFAKIESAEAWIKSNGSAF